MDGFLMEFLYDPAISLLGIYLKQLKQGLKEVFVIPTFIAAVFTIAATPRQFKCPQWMNRSMKCGICIEWNIIQP
jgi:hypothetical protein